MTLQNRITSPRFWRVVRKKYDSNYQSNNPSIYYKPIMSLNIIVLAKQVPDTRNVGKDAMKEDGTINRAALPAIFNPEDLNALEQALRLKDSHPGSTVTLLTMGLPRVRQKSSARLFIAEQTAVSYSLTESSEVPTLSPRPTRSHRQLKSSATTTSSSAAVRLSTVTPHR